MREKREIRGEGGGRSGMRETRCSRRRVQSISFVDT